MSDLTRPERFAQRREAKRYAAAIKREGLCCACKWRDRTAGVWHCKGYPDRQRGICETDGRLPRFTFDDSVLERFRDAA